MSDPRKAPDLDAASKNPDGTYNGAKALSWLSEVLCPGKGLPEAEIVAMWEEAKRKRGLK